MGELSQNQGEGRSVNANGGIADLRTLAKPIYFAVKSANDALFPMYTRRVQRGPT